MVDYYYNTQRYHNPQPFELEVFDKAEIHYPTSKVEVFNFAQNIIDNLIERVIPEIPKALAFDKAGKCLKVLGKIWNLSEYPPTNFLNETVCNDSEERLLDMEGYVDEYQYLHLEAVNMGLTDVKVIPQQFVWLLSVDLSGNCLSNTSACVVNKLPNIVALRLDNNRFCDPYMPPMKHLQYLGLSYNKIESLHRIYHPNLETLGLNFNLIDTVYPSDCWKLSKLRQLELRGNKLTTTSGIAYQNLVNLYLGENQITKLEGLETLICLERLHLRENPLSDLSGFSQSNVNLKYLNIRGCAVESAEEISKLSVLQGLKELMVRGNPFYPEIKKKGSDEEDEGGEGEEEEVGESDSSDVDEVRVKILMYLPKLKRIDKKPVTREEVEFAQNKLEEEQ